MMDPCKALEPRVIDNALIERCIDLQYPKGEVGRLARQEGIPMEEVDEIRFEFMNILKIDHLWILKSLTKLSLNNNLIEKIENLDTLVYLKQLDLSFNKIKKIEGLDKLVNLEKISFYENFIETIENMDTLTKVTVFSIGKNKVHDWTNVHYFRRFKHLTSLNMAGNPCAEEENFRIYVAAFLPQIIYYEYRKIENSEREQGREMFERILRDLEKVEAELNAKKEAIEKELADAELHSKSFVEYLNSSHLFEEMYEVDEEGKAFLDLGDEVTELHDEYKQQFTEVCKQIFEVGQKHYAIRKVEEDNFMQSVEAAKKSNQDESIGHMEAFLDTKNDIFGKIKHLQELLDHDAIVELQYDDEVAHLSDIFKDSVHTTWKKLMKLELQLFDQMEEVNQVFEHTLEEMINNFVEEVQGLFAQMRALEMSYMENVGDIAVRTLTNINLNEEEPIPPSLKNILTDRDAVANALAGTHDVHMLTIDNREDRLVSRSKSWVENLIKSLQKDEIKRNRYKLLEINHFLDIQKEEFDELTNPGVTDDEGEHDELFTL